MAKIRIALAQINATLGDFKANEEKILDYVKKAKALKADIVAFPEMSVCGFSPEALAHKKSFIDCNRRALRRIGKNVTGITVVLGFAEEEEGAVFSAASILQERKVAGVAKKMIDCRPGSSAEKKEIPPDRVLKPLFCLDEVTFFVEPGGAGVSEEPNKLIINELRQKVDIVFHLVALPFSPGEAVLREGKLVRRAKKCMSAVVCVNAVGGQDEFVFSGGSVILDHRGAVVARGELFEEKLIVADIDTGGIRTTKSKAGKSVNFGCGRAAGTGEKECVRLFSASVKKRKPAVTSGKARKMDRQAETYRALVMGTGDYVRKNAFSGVVLGLSGGIDSSLVACIAVDALGPEKVTGLSMPSRYSSKETMRDARRLAEKLKIRLICVPVEGIFRLYLETLRPEFAGIREGKTEENLQARIRGNILMAFSNKFNWLVLATGNKSETSTGYCTLYGDMVGGFAVLKDISKLMTYKLAAYRNKTGRVKVIPESIIKRAPTAELKHGQKDEDVLPPYTVLDRILEAIERGDEYHDIIAAGFSPITVKKIIRRVNGSEFKRRQAPIGIRIIPKRPEDERRLPITNKYKGF